MAFKDRLDKFVKKNFSGLGGVSEDVAKKEAERFKDILIKHINTLHSENARKALSHIAVGNPIRSDNKINKDGTMSIKFTVDVDFLDAYRESLYPEKYPHMVFLPYIFNYGYNAIDRVFAPKDSNSKYPYSKTSRPNTNFIEAAVDEFNRTSKVGAKVIFNSETYSGLDFGDV